MALHCYKLLKKSCCLCIVHRHSAACAAITIITSCKLAYLRWQTCDIFV